MLNYYIKISEQHNLSVRELRIKIKNNEYERLDEETKLKLINKENTEVRDFIKEPIIINQTTLSFLEWNNIHKEILENIPKANIIDEICPVTRIRQENIINLKKDYDLLIIIGSKTSSNTSKLYELALKYHLAKFFKI